MKKVIQQLLGCIITITLTIFLVQSVGHILDPRWTEDGFDAIRAFDSVADDSFDVMIFGSSHAWKGCDTSVMRDEYGLRAYNYGCNWQGVNTTLLFLKNALLTQNPKVVCIETARLGSVEEDVDLNGQIYYTRNMKNFDGKMEYLKQCFNGKAERYVSYYVPIVMFHDNWTNIDWENFYFPGPQRFIDSNGYYSCEVVNVYEEPDQNLLPQQALSEESKAELDKIMALCDERGIKVLFYTCPWAGPNLYADAMREYVADKSCEYVDIFDYTDEIGLDYTTDLQDADHLNDSGSGKVARFLAEYIITSLHIAD